MTSLLESVPAEDACGSGAEVARRLLDLYELSGAARVALYAALPGELPTVDLLAALRARGQATLFPRCTEAGRLEFAPAENFEELASGRYGVAEPVGPAVRLDPRDAVVVPGLAFDVAGHRLGRGGGFYDRTFPVGDAGPFLVGVGFAFQRLDDVPAGARDRGMDAVVTETESLRVTKERSGE